MISLIRISFEPTVIDIALDRLLPLRPMTTRITASRKYARIVSSIGQIGIIEPLVVTKADGDGRHMLLDGHLRLHALQADGAARAPCIVSDDDEAFTYNKRVNRLATVQEHYMITRAIERGVPSAMIAAALGMDEKSLGRRRSLLDGISLEAVEILKDKQVSTAVFDVLRRLRPHKQFAAAEMMASMNNFTASYARAILAATPQDHLANPDKPKKLAGVTPEQMARMERELESLNTAFRAREATFGDDVLQLVLSAKYVERLIANGNVAGYLAERHPEILVQFRTVAQATSLDAG
jgi:hypothetical protein